MIGPALNKPAPEGWTYLISTLHKSTVLASPDCTVISGFSNHCYFPTVQKVWMSRRWIKNSKEQFNDFVLMRWCLKHLFINSQHSARHLLIVALTMQKAVNIKKKLFILFSDSWTVFYSPRATPKNLREKALICGLCVEAIAHGVASYHCK